MVHDLDDDGSIIIKTFVEHAAAKTANDVVILVRNKLAAMREACKYVDHKLVAKKKGTEKSIRMIIPQDIEIEILSQLPFTSLLRFETVCTNWRYLLTKDSYFQRLHSERRLTDPTAGISSQLKALSILQQIESQPEMLAKLNFDLNYLDDIGWSQHARQRPNVLVIARESEINKCLDQALFLYLNQGLGSQRFPCQVNIMSGDPTFFCRQFQQQSFRFKYLDLVVLFELDEMLSRGCRKQINFMHNFFPKEVKVKKISATMPLVSLELWRKEMILKKAIIKAERYEPSFKPDDLFMEDFMERVDQEKLLPIQACGRQRKLKCRQNSDKRKKKSTISWNPHSKMHR